MRFWAGPREQVVRLRERLESDQRGYSRSPFLRRTKMRLLLCPKMNVARVKLISKRTEDVTSELKNGIPLPNTLIGQMLNHPFIALIINVIPIDQQTLFLQRYLSVHYALQLQSADGVKTLCSVVLLVASD